MYSSRKRQAMPISYGIMHRAVIQMGRLSISSEAVYTLLASNTGAAKHCRPSQATIAADLGISRSNVLRSITELEKVKHLRRSELHDDPRLNNKYKLMVLGNALKAPGRHMQTGTGETFEGVSPETQKKNAEEKQKFDE